MTVAKGALVATASRGYDLIAPFISSIAQLGAATAEHCGLDYDCQSTSNDGDVTTSTQVTLVALGDASDLVLPVKHTQMARGAVATAIQRPA